MAKFEFVTPNHINKQFIKTGLDHVSGKAWLRLQREPYNFYLKFRKRANDAHVFFVPHENVNFISSVEKSSDIAHAGTYFGFIEKKEFFLSLEGAEFIKDIEERENNMDLKFIKISSQGARSFLYGNDIPLRYVIKKPQELNRKQIVFIVDESDRFLGIAYIFIPYESPSERQKRGTRRYTAPKMQIRNLIDYGYYIRRGF